MDDILGRTIGALLLVGMILFCTALFLNSTDANIQTKLKDDSCAFVDSCRAKGCIDPGALKDYWSKVGNCGDFVATIYVDKKTSYYDDGENKIIHSTLRVTEEELIEAIYPDTGDDVPYRLYTGDRISIEIHRTGAGFTAMFGLIGRGGRSGDLISEYSGLVLHDSSIEKEVVP